MGPGREFVYEGCRACVIGRSCWWNAGSIRGFPISFPRSGAEVERGEGRGWTRGDHFLLQVGFARGAGLTLSCRKEAAAAMLTLQSVFP